VHLTEGRVDAPLHTLKGVRDLDGAHNGELLVQVLLQGGSDDALGVALHLQGGGAVNLVSGGGRAHSLLGVVVHLAGQDQVSDGGIGEQQRGSGEVVLGSHGGEAHVGDSVSHAEAEGQLVRNLAVVLATDELSGHTTGEGAVASTDGSVGLGQTVHVELTSDGGAGVHVLEGQISLVRVVTLELKLEAGNSVHQGSLNSQLKVVGELELLQCETGSVRVLKGNLGLQGLLALLVDNLDVGGEGRGARAGGLDLQAELGVEILGEDVSSILIEFLEDSERHDKV